MIGLASLQAHMEVFVQVFVPVGKAVIDLGLCSCIYTALLGKFIQACVSTALNKAKVR